LTFRLDRFQILAFAGLVTAFVVLAGWQVVQLSAFHIPRECFGNQPPEGPLCEQYGNFVSLAGLGSGMVGVATFAPWVLGVLLGVPLAAHEIEDGSAQLTWALDRRTGRWFVHRFFVGLAVVVVLATALGVAADALEAALYPQWDPGASFHDIGSRGLSVVARAVAAYSLGALLGVVVGRVLPAIILAGIAAGVLAVALASGTTYGWIQPAQLPEASIDGSYRISGLAYGRAGAVYSAEQVAAVNPYKVGTRPSWKWVDENYERVAVAVPPSRYPEAVAAESGALLLGSAFAVALGTVIVRRRRPSV
jgi:hypothetical protein